MKKAKRVCKYVATAFLVLLVSLCVYTFIVTDLMKKDYVNVCGYTYFVVATGSMSGTIEVNDIIFVRLTKNVEVDDIVTYKNRDGDLITHRLINKTGDSYVTKGDVNNVADEAITKNQIIGKVKLVISTSFILKSVAIFLIIFILLALINFDSVVKKFIVNDSSKKDNDNDSNAGKEALDSKNNTSTSNKIPENIFVDPNKRYEEPSSGLTVTIAIDEMEALQKSHETEVVREEKEEELAGQDEFVFAYEPLSKRKKNSKEKETIEFLVSILKCKKNNVSKTRMNKKWLKRYQYVYKLCHLLLNENYDQFIAEIKNPPFKEIYDYDLDHVGLTQSVRNRIYDMPVYVFLRMLTYTILYNDDEVFDGIYKILKYKATIDSNQDFISICHSDPEARKQLNTLINFMKKVSNRFDNKNVFELDKIERMVKIVNY